MAERTVTVRLRLDSTQWASGSRSAEASTTRLAGRAQAAATAAERSAQRTAQAVGGTFSGVARQGQASLRGLEAAATRSSQALARSGQAMTRQTAQASTSASRAAQAASTAAVQGTRRVQAAAGELPAAFRAAGQSARGSMGQVSAAAAGSAQALAGVESRMSAATAAAAAGTSRLSLANRLALAEAAQASQAAAARTAAAAGASSSAYAQIAARARAMGSTVAAQAGRSERSLKAARAASLGLVAAFGLAVYASSRFEKAMSGVKAATQASGRELAQLRQAAIDAGQRTQYSATQAAEAETELAKAGVSTSDILGGALRGTLNLAASGQLDVADAAVVASKAMNSFNLSGGQMSHIADVIAAAAGKSATDVHQMSLAFAQSSLLAHQTGLSIEQTAGALALFAQNGLVGSDAGTSLKTMLMRLTPQSSEAQAMMEKLGFSAYDSSGRFVGLTETAARMQKAFGKLSPEARNAAMGVIFGSDAIRAATIVTQAGASGIDRWTKAANDQGYAARYAATQTDNLAGDLQRLKSALETAFIQSGSAANGVLRDMAQALTAVVRWYNELPHGVQQSVTLLGGLAGVVGLVASGLLLALPRIMAVRRELQALGVTAAGTRTAMLGLGRLSLVVGAVAILGQAFHQLDEQFKDTPPNVEKLTSSMVDFARKGSASGELANKFGKNLDGLGEAVERVAHPGALNRISDALYTITHFGADTTGLEEARDGLTAIDESLAALVSSGHADEAAANFRAYAKAANDSGTSTEKFRTLLPQYADALTTAGTQAKLAGDSQGQLGDAVGQTVGEMKDQRSEAEKLSDALNDLNGRNISVAEAQISFRQSLADLTSAVKDNGHSLDVTTDKGRKVKSAYLDAAKAAAEHAQKVTDQTGVQAKGRAAFEADIAVLKRTMKQAGFTDGQIKNLIDTFAKVPPKTRAQITAETAQAQADLQAVQNKIRNTKGRSVTVNALTKTAESALKSLGFKVTHMKNGKVSVAIPTGGPSAAVRSIQGWINGLHGRTVPINIVTTHTDHGTVAHEGGNYARGGLVPGYAGGGPVQAFPYGGLVRGPGTGTSDSILAFMSHGAARVSDREFVVNARATSRWLPLLEAINGGRLQRFARGGLAGGGLAGGGFTYTPADVPGTLGAGTGMDRYNTAVQRLKDAWTKLTAALVDQRKKTQSLRDAEANLSRVRRGHHTATQLANAEKKLRDARQASAKANAAVRSDRGAVNAADTALGLRAGSRAAAFNLKAYSKQLADAARANARWESDLSKIGKRAGADVEETLRGMGEEGRSLVGALAKASGKTFTDIVNNLKRLAPTAKATLADYTNQLKTATSTSKAFQDNLLKLASMGYGDLATQLAAQGDENAAAIAAAAVRSPSSAAAANTAAKANAGLLSSDDVTNAMTLLGVLRGTPGAGIADVIAAGLDWSTIRGLAPKITAQIKALAGSDHFVQQMRGQGVAMARGGILTQPTTVLAAEAGSVESWIPWNSSARSAALLAKTAAAMGYQLVPARQFAGSAPAASAVAREVTRQITVHLHGAKQSAAEQAADIARVINFVG